MRVQHIGYQVKGFYRAAKLGMVYTMTTTTAVERLEILEFAAKYGRAAACDAFKIARRTFARHKANYKSRGLPGLNRKSTAPKTPRRRMWARETVEEIRRLRTIIPNLGKAKIHKFLAPFCKQHRLPLPSASTIGRIIADDPQRMRIRPTRLTPAGKRKPLRRNIRRARPRPHHTQAPLQTIAADVVVRIKDGIRRYIITFIDPNSRVAFACATTSASSKQTTIVFDALCQLLGQTPKYVLTDNGGEFQKHFQNRLDELGIQHLYTYPHCPKMNAHAERFNRTIQEQFADYHDELLLDNITQFNQKLAQWLIQYNTILPHHGIGLKTPIQCLAEYQPDCHMYWTNTPPTPARQNRIQYRRLARTLPFAND